MPVCTVNCISLIISNLCCVFSYKKKNFFLLFFLYIKIRVGIRQEVEILCEYLVIDILLSGCWLQDVTLLQCFPDVKFSRVRCVILEVLPELP